MRLALPALALLTGLASAGEIRVDRNYPWGSLRLSAAHSEPVQSGGRSLLVFQKDVLADFHFSHGPRLLVATGRLEFDPANGDFTATDWPFFLGRQSGRETQSLAKNATDSIQLRGGRLYLAGMPKAIIPEPAIVQTRRKQMAALEAR